VIFVDTSVWIEALRSAESTEAQHLTALLDSSEVALAAPVRIEILSGASNRDNPRLRRVLSALPVFFPRQQTWARMEEWLDLARTAGERFGFADFLIAAIAADHDGEVWSLDSDFARMNSVGLVRIYRP
jgi:predicted nucleic acid-binding protein